MLVVTSNIQIPPAEMRFTFSRSGGPGGQNVNKVNSKVTLHWDVANSPSLPADVRDRLLTRFSHRINAQGEVVIYSQQHREQPQNRAECLDKLRQLILAALHPPKRRRRTKPSRASRERRLREKHHKGEKKRLRRRPPME